MPQILIASNNPHKIEEFQSILSGSNFTLTPPKEVGIDPNFDVAETSSTFKQNAILKAKAFAHQSSLPSLADDSGLEVDALSGRPGIFSKRYGRDDHHRCQKLLSELEGVPEEKRSARFICVVAFHDPVTGISITRTGQVAGKIARQEQGSAGFGYDPIFIPIEGNGRSFGELGQTYKNHNSHRARALRQIKPLLFKYFNLS